MADARKVLEMTTLNWDLVLSNKVESKFKSRYTYFRITLLNR